MHTPLTAHSVVRTLPTVSAARDRRPLPPSVVLSLRDHLVAESWITAAQFQEGLRRAESQQIALTDALVDLFNIPETAAYEALSLAAGMRLIDLDTISISPLAIQLIPERIARRCGAVPVAEDNRTLTFVTSQPFSTETDQDISFASGRHPQHLLARPSQIEAALERFYPHDTGDSVSPFRPKPATVPEQTAAADAIGVNDDATSSGRTTKKKRVLVADDDRMLRMLVRMLLEKDGYDVLEAQDGRAAIEAVRVHEPDLLIADLIMPDLDGYEAVASLRSEHTGRDLPVILLTAEPRAIAEKTVLFLGADDYVTKPFDSEALLSRVRSVFVRRLSNTSQ